MNAVVTASEGAGGIEVVLPPMGEIFYAAIVLLLILLVLGKYALPQIYASLDEREQKISDGIDAADRAHELEALATREREKVLKEANVEAQKLRQEANQDAKRIVREAQESAQAEALRVTDSAKRQIAAERQAAEISLKSEVGLLATELAEKIIGEQLKNTDVTTRVVDRFLDDLDKELSVGAEVENR